MKTIGTLFILLMSISLNAQDYFANNPQWRQSSSCRWFGECIEEQEFVYYINGDSVVDNITYKKLFKHGRLDQSWMGPEPHEGCDDHYTFDTFHMLVRQEGKKIFIKETGDVDTLLYDFNLIIGDTIPVTWNQSLNNIVVVGIDSLLVGNSFRTVFHLDATTNNSLIEGIGNDNGFLEPVVIDLECGYNLNCYALNDTTYYPEQGAQCDLAVSVPQNREDEMVNIYPNPAYEFIYIKPVNFTLKEKAQIDIFNINGKMVYSEAFNNGKRRINVNQWPNGMFIFKIVANGFETNGKFIVRH